MSCLKNKTIPCDIAETKRQERGKGEGSEIGGYTAAINGDTGILTSIGKKMGAILSIYVPNEKRNKTKQKITDAHSNIKIRNKRE